MQLTQNVKGQATMNYSITLINEETGDQKTIQVPEDEFIYDIAELEGIDLPASCRAGSCISCAGKVISGSVEHERAFLKPEEEDAGFMLTCSAYPRSDCKILVNQEDSLLEFCPN